MVDLNEFCIKKRLELERKDKCWKMSMLIVSYAVSDSSGRCRFIMAELLQTERTYVKDLETCINVSRHSPRAGCIGWPCGDNDA